MCDVDKWSQWVIRRRKNSRYPFKKGENKLHQSEIHFVKPGTIDLMIWGNAMIQIVQYLEWSQKPCCVFLEMMTYLGKMLTTSSDVSVSRKP